MMITDGSLVMNAVAVDDEVLSSIIADKSQLLDPYRLREFLDMDGDNLHILTLEGKVRPRLLLRYLREFKKQFKTISWFDREFKQIRGNLCHQS